jgi:hypothetical protein
VKGFLERYKYHFFIVLVAIIGYWQVALFRYTLKWDMLDYFFPWRYFISECLRNDILPFWNPYQAWGYAIHADPQSGVWYPVVWIISLLHGYDLKALHFEFMLHIILAGIGMFLLVSELVHEKKVGFLAGCAYMMSGFVIGHGQHLSFIISCAWVPFVLFYYLKLCARPNLLSALQCSLCFFMLTTGGYPAYTIIAGYALLIIFIVKVIKAYRFKDFILAKKFFRFNLLIAGLTALLCSGTIVSTFISFSYISRSTKLPLSEAYLNPFSPQSLLSLLWPVASGKDPAFFDTDISMSNFYFGILMLAVFVTALFRRKTAFEKVVLYTGLFLLLVSFGEYTPARGLIYYTVPLMNMFRFPSTFILPALVCFLISSAYLLKNLTNVDSAYWKRLRQVLLFVLFLYISTLIVFLLKDSLRLSFPGNINQLIGRLDFNESIVLQSLISIVLLLATIICMYKWKNRYSVLSIFILIDILAASQLNIPVSVVSETKTASLKRTLNKIHNKAFPLPENIAAENFSDTTVNVRPLWKNTNTFVKKPAYDVFNSFQMKGYYKATDSSLFFLPLLKNNLAFFSDTFSFYRDTIHEKEVLIANPTHLFFKESDSVKLASGLSRDTSAKALFTEFNPSHIAVITQSHTLQYFTLMQHDYPLWQVTVDGKPVEFYVSDYLFMTTLLPPGMHRVEYKFQTGSLKIAGIISILLTVSILVFVAIIGFMNLGGQVTIQRDTFTSRN